MPHVATSPASAPFRPGSETASLGARDATTTTARRRVLVAGATGAVGLSLVPALVARGHTVGALSRHADRIPPEIAHFAVDALDPQAVSSVCEAFAPDVIIHQLTALPPATSLWRFDRDFEITNRLRTEGTRNLLDAARQCGAVRFVAQSFCGWPYARTGSSVKTETDPLDPTPPPRLRSTIDAIRQLEALVLDATDLNGVILRYGGFYGPNTHLAPGSSMAEAVRKRRLPLIGQAQGVWSFAHIEDVASATTAAAESDIPGLFNVVDDEPAPVDEWLPFLASAMGAPSPRRMPVWLARLLLPEHLRVMMTEARGGSNALFKRTFAWQPRYPSWRVGFPAVFRTEREANR